MSSGLAVPARARLRRPLPTGVVRGAYPERRDEPESGLDEWLRRLTAPAARRWRVRRSAPPDLCARVGTHAAELAALSSSALREQARDVGRDLRVEGLGGDAAVRAAALVREAASRELGMAHHDVQLVGGWLMLQGYLAEMDTGEGKTLTATVPAAVAGLAGVPVHVVTVNEYLARRDAETMRPVYEALGLSVGLVCADQPPDARRAAYACDVTYCTNKDLVFDYLRDRVAIREQGGVRLRVSRVAGRSEAKLLHRGDWLASCSPARTSGLAPAIATSSSWRRDRGIWPGSARRRAACGAGDGGARLSSVRPSRPSTSTSAIATTSSRTTRSRSWTSSRVA
jgi:hypothetical protein